MNGEGEWCYLMMGRKELIKNWRYWIFISSILLNYKFGHFYCVFFEKSKKIMMMMICKTDVKEFTSLCHEKRKLLPKWEDWKLLGWKNCPCKLLVNEWNNNYSFMFLTFWDRNPRQKVNFLIKKGTKLTYQWFCQYDWGDGDDPRFQIAIIDPKLILDNKNSIHHMNQKLQIQQ